MNPIDLVKVGFSTNLTSPVSSVIRHSTGKPYSHVWLLYFDQTLEQMMVLEAGAAGLYHTPFKRFVQHNHVVLVLDPKVPLLPGLRRLSQEVGEKYDHLGLVGMAWVVACEWAKVQATNPFRSAKGRFCSEAVGVCMVWSGHPGTEGWDVQSISPSRIEGVLS